ncbi:Calsyntenin-1 [Strongyloides ratti]|uniref:Calsyntenin-1 n=1 Tax=Strongyloides ratti TaxID=34506 RepID=A0A090LP82_STRRB|nr:Calsyntenin-1 [Strongyloides ratti]CEF71571.1 Calsyntenin-1 [Strongyloides ratti]
MIHFVLYFYVLFAITIALNNGYHPTHHRVPIINTHGADMVIGKIREDQRIVEIVPKLEIVSETGPVCTYEIYNDNKPSEIPFEFEVIDEEQGYAILHVKENYVLDCHQNEFTFRLVAVRCGGEKAKSEPVPIKITVSDVNNYAPEFDAPWYTYEIEEGTINTEIARLYAKDKDCGHPYGEICKYEINNNLENSPFTINDQGIISNTRPLNYSSTDSHILTITAQDCGMKKSKSILVTIKVYRKCIDEVTSIPDVIFNDNKKDDMVRIADVADIITCPKSEENCKSSSVKAIFTGTFKGRCNKPMFDDAIKGCNLNKNTINLLPRPKMVEKDLSYNNDNNKLKPTLPASIYTGEEGNEKYVFDGKTNTAIVPSTEIIPPRFFLTFSMKHDKGNKEDQKIKQNILCESDGSHLNRHHFAVYIRHCKLELLMRREAKNSDPEFKSAEWRWHLDEVCDNQWHTYVIKFNNLDNVELFVDGNKFNNNERNPEILDDWPLHKTENLKTKLVVGACWHGRTEEMVQHFKGQLSSMYLLPNDVEEDEKIDCLGKCSEEFNYDYSEPLGNGQKVIIDHNIVTLEALNVDDLVDMMAKITYKNTQKYIIPGNRTVTIDVEMNCDNGEHIKFLGTKMNINVKKIEVLPVLTVSGSPTVHVIGKNLKNGVSMFPDIEISAVNAEEGVDLTEKSTLDWCQIHLNPSRDLDLEYFSSPASLIALLNVDFEHDKQGILLKGKEKISGYRDIIRQINYFSTRIDAYSKRTFILQCSMMDGKVESNKFTAVLDIKDNSNEENPILPIKPFDAAFVDENSNTPVLQIDDDFEKHFEPTFDQSGSNRLQNILELDLPRPKALYKMGQGAMGQGAIAGGAVAVVVVVCVGFLLVLLVVGVLKMRDAPVQRRGKGEKDRTLESGMEWDDSGMNITVNPLEDVEKNDEECVYEDENSSDCESMYSYRAEDDITEDDDDDDEEMEPVLPHAQNSRQGLEWDDSTLTNVSRTYRV